LATEEEFEFARNDSPSSAVQDFVESYIAQTSIENVAARKTDRTKRSMGE
jgi:hypothetical protein